MSVLGWILCAAALLVLAALAYVGARLFRMAALRAPKPFLADDPTVTGGAYIPAQDERMGWLATQRHHALKITSADGLKLHATFISAPEPAGRTALVIHGFTCRGEDMLGMARIFVEELGYNVLLPDCRAHGRSEGRYIGYGWLDRLDILQWIARVLQQQGAQERIVLYGVSMGGATVMMTAGEQLPPNVRALVEDCGYSSVRDELTYQMHRLFHLPSFPLLDAASLACRLCAGFFFGEASAVAQLRKNTLPILFIHGEEDTFVPYAMLNKVQAATRGEKLVYSVPHATHGGAYAMNPSAYADTLRDFLARAMSA